MTFASLFWGWNWNLLKLLETLLGVTLDANLTFNEHNIVSTVSSRMSRLGKINRVKHVFDKNARIIIINELLFSKLFYCSSVWRNTTQSNLNKLPAVQNIACRIVSGARKFDHIRLVKGLWLAPSQATAILLTCCFSI